MKELLQLANIELGALLDAANEYLAEVSQDVLDRPHIGDAREVSIKIQLKPDVQYHEGCATNMPTIDWAVGKKMPGCKGMTTRAYAEDGKLIINTGLPLGGNPRQRTIFDNEKEAG
jgi:hypothetical protein